MEFIGQSLSVAEIIGTISGLIAVWLTVKENRWCFPVGIISCFIYSIIFFDNSVRFYSDAILQLVYVVLLVYGWITWSGSRQVKTLHVTRMDARERAIAAGIIITGSLAIGYAFKKFTDASLPFVDAFTTSVSLVAQWIVARKKLENWSLWIMANVIYVGMYAYKGLNVTAVYYLILLFLAVAGLREWRKHLVIIPS